MKNGVDVRNASEKEDYFIAQDSRRPKEDMLDEERAIVAKLNAQIVFEEGCCFYKFQEEAIAVARMLISAKPSRHLAVIARRTGAPEMPRGLFKQ